MCLFDFQGWMTQMYPCPLSCQSASFFYPHKRGPPPIICEFKGFKLNIWEEGRVLLWSEKKSERRS